MVYIWDGKEEECYRMYIEEKRSLEDIMDYMKVHHNFAPSKRAFQTQFKKWEFPSKQNPAHRNVALVSRVKELWEHNTSQRDMLAILNSEGHDIKERELMRVRAKNRWLLRVPNGMKSSGKAAAQENINPSTGDIDADLIARFQQEARMDPDAATSNNQPPRDTSPGLSEEVIQKRRERMQKLEEDSNARWATRKRRRRTRGWAGLPADPPGPPRFPSETTIDESKAFLSLDNELYRDIRDKFQEICEQGGFVKKTAAGPDKWQAAKDELIQYSGHLQAVFMDTEVPMDSKALALDVVCSDVTKRMRTLERRMTIAEAKNVLGVNPEQSREIRNAFYQTLKADHFTSKLEAGDEHWRELKDQWIRGSPLLLGILAGGDDDPQHQSKLRALEVLCRDVMKRLRDDQTKRDPSRKKQRVTGPGPGPAAPKSSLAQQQVQVAAQAQELSLSGLGQEDSDLQIDPSLLMAANDPSIGMGEDDGGQLNDSFATSAAYGSEQQPTIPVYFRLSPLSQMPQAPKMWLGILTSISITELRQLATMKHPNTSIVRIDGVAKDDHNNEISFGIDDDEELEAYLAYVQGAKVTFNVHLVGAYS
ncbi:MAG: hypothetical protein M1825_000599 [Sarcosagium campestre]|nr:MAG: hypothetical protein M1825_000599 [Sarcosagium campestre]